MALPNFAPALTKTRQAIAESSQKAILRLVPELETGTKVSSRSLTIIGTVIALLMLSFMFVITSMSTQDAFTLAKLQREAQVRVHLVPTDSLLRCHLRHAFPESQG